MTHLTIQELKALSCVMTRTDVSYIPTPNTVDVLISDLPAPANITPTAFMFAFTPTGDLVLSNNRRRGLEVPGGHVEPGESMKVAAKRETFEETGALMDSCFPVGIFRNTTEGQRPEGYRYPFPLSCQQFYAGVATALMRYVENDECLSPEIVKPGDVHKKLSVGEYELYKVAFEKLFPNLCYSRADQVFTV